MFNPFCPLTPTGGGGGEGEGLFVIEQENRTQATGFGSFCGELECINSVVFHVLCYISFLVVSGYLLRNSRRNPHHLSSDQK